MIVVIYIHFATGAALFVRGDEHSRFIQACEQVIMFFSAPITRGVLGNGVFGRVRSHLL